MPCQLVSLISLMIRLDAILPVDCPTKETDTIRTRARDGAHRPVSAGREARFSPETPQSTGRLQPLSFAAAGWTER